MTNEEAVEILMKMMQGYASFSQRLAIGKAIKVLKQPERKKGKWIECERVGYTQFHPDYSSFYSVFRCTSCLKANYRKEKYCPNCGAEMEGEE